MEHDGAKSCWQDFESTRIHLLDTTWADDSTFMLQDLNPEQLHKLRTLTRLVVEHAMAMGLVPNMQPGKTEALLSLRGAGAKKAALANFAGNLREIQIDTARMGQVKLRISTLQPPWVYHRLQGYSGPRIAKKVCNCLHGLRRSSSDLPESEGGTANLSCDVRRGCGELHFEPGPVDRHGRATVGVIAALPLPSLQAHCGKAVGSAGPLCAAVVGYDHCNSPSTFAHWFERAGFHFLPPC